MIGDLFRSFLFSAVAATVAAAAVPLASAFAAEASSRLESPQVVRMESDKTLPRFYLTPGMHQSVIDELIRGEPENARGQQNRARSTEEKNEPTSMLWPAYKFLPRISHSATA